MKSSSAGFDNISLSVFKHNFDNIGLFVTGFYNRSLKSGIFPNSLKVAKNKCIFKKDRRCDVNNYRHISILPAFGKTKKKQFLIKFIIISL